MTLELDNLTPREVELVKWLAERTKERDAAQAALAAEKEATADANGVADQLAEIVRKKTEALAESQAKVGDVTMRGNIEIARLRDKLAASQEEAQHYADIYNQTVAAHDKLTKELADSQAEVARLQHDLENALVIAANTVTFTDKFLLERLRSPAATRTESDSELLAALEQIIPHTWRQMSDFDSVLHDIGIFVRDRDAALKDSETKSNA